MENSSFLQLTGPPVARPQPGAGKAGGNQAFPQQPQQHDPAELGHIDLSSYDHQDTRAGSSDQGGERPAIDVSPPSDETGAQLVLPAVPRGVRLSRQLVREICKVLELGDVADVAELLASEVVTNAVLHANTRSLKVVVQVRRDELVVSVTDSDNTAPTVRPAGPDALSGRGLFLLDTLAQDWGVTEWPDGEAVWFTLSVADAPVIEALGDIEIGFRSE